MGIYVSVPYEFPSDTFSGLDMPAHAIAARLLNDPSMPRYSLTLVPDNKNGRSVRPYELIETKIPDLGYLFNLSQTNAHGAKVLKAHPEDLDSGFDVTTKNLRLDTKSNCQALSELYARYSEQEIKAILASPKGAEFTKLQLELLGKHLQEPSLSEKEVYDAERNILRWNEIVAAVCTEHIEAIYAPIFGFEESEQWERVKPVFELQAAIAGLQHLEKGIDLPVVFYHVTEPQKGSCTYFAQGKQMLEEKAQSALKELCSKDTSFDSNIKLWLVIQKQEIGRLLGKEAVATLPDAILPATEVVKRLLIATNEVKKNNRSFNM